MGILRQISASVANSSKITISMWVRLDTISDSNPSYVIQWGERASFSNSYIRFNILDTNEIEFAFSSRHNSLVKDLGDDTWSYVPDGGANVDSVSSAHTVAVFGTITSAWVVGLWVHLLIAIDLSSAATDVNPQNPFYSSLFVKYTAAASVNGSVVTVDKDVGIAQDDDLFQPGNDGSSVAVFPISIQGFEIGIPVQLADAALNLGLKLAYMQIWVGQFIDPANPDNLAKFVKPLPGGHGTLPDNRTAAADAFGTPTYFFKGSDGVNLGTGGPFLKVGTINDVSAPGF